MKAGVLLLALAVFPWCQAALAQEEDFYDETILRTLQLEFSQSDWWSQLTDNYQTKQNISATLIVDDATYEGVGVRFRGNTSYMMTGDSQKKSFNIEIDYTDEDQRLMGYKTLNLINCMSDATFMREVLYSNLCRQVIPSAKANFVKLEINGENWGIYANVQQLNAEFIEDWFPSNNGTRWRAEGNMGGGDMGGGGGRAPRGTMEGGTNEVAVLAEIAEGGVTSGLAALTWLGTDSADYEAVYELKNTGQDDPWASLIQACDVLNNTPIDQLADELKYVLNVDRALWLCAFEIIFTDDDGYVNKRGSDYCLYYEPETGRLHLIQYDGNECMSDGQWDLFYREDESEVPLMNRLMQINEYQQRYLTHVRAILDLFLTEEVMFEKIEAYRALIEEEVIADDKKLESCQAFTRGIDDLKDFVTERRDYLLSSRALTWSAPEIASVAQEAVRDDGGETLSVTVAIGDSVAAADVQLFVAAGPFALFESVSMADDGLHGDGVAGDDVFGVTLSGYPSGTVLRYYVQATGDNSARNVTFSPPGAEHDVYTHVMTYPDAAYAPIVINELVAHNETTITDAQGEYDDWIELKNVSSDVVDLSGMYLSDKAEHPLKWQFPEGTVLEPGAYLLIWADEDGGDEPGLHANFRLASAGETIWLFDTVAAGHALLDSVTFADLGEDQSFGRLPDGEGAMQVLPAPSPNEANEE